VPREAGSTIAAIPAARLTQSYGYLFDTVRVRTAYRCRAYPDNAQQQALARTFGCVRLVWNRTLAARHAHWQAERTSTSYAQTDAALTQMKREPGLAFLARYQRRLARRQKGSANRAKAAATVARAHRKVRCARQDFLHKASTSLVRSADAIVIEDLAVKNMIRSRRLARAISDCGWGEFRRQLAYKCQRYGRELIVIDRWYPSSKTCSACGHLLAELNLSTRYWTCPACRARHDRDLNAAKNILAAGLAVARDAPGGACGADVRHSGSSRVQSAVKQEPRPVTAGIPVLQGGE
jgi:IS605 OrfB family transposase